MSKDTEQLLLEQLSEGDTSAFETLFMCYNDRMVNFLSRLVRDHELARDMSQEIFTKIWDKRVKMATIENFSAYLFQAARFTVCDYFDHVYVVENYVKQVTQKSSEPVDSDSEERLFLEELQQIITNAVNTKLTDQQRRIYHMSREEGMSNDEISKILGISKRTVENHISAALRILHKAVYLTFILKYGCNL